ERAGEVKPDDYQSWCLLIHVYRSLDRTDKIEAAARKGIALAEKELALHPENPRPAALGAAGLLAIGETERAREWLTRALAIDPDDLLTLYNAACVYAQLGEAEPALDLLEQIQSRLRFAELRVDARCVVESKKIVGVDSEGSR